MNQTTKIELEAFLNFDERAKIVWLSRLIFQVSTRARDTYEVGTEDVVSPKKLRLFNELLHRLSSFMLTMVSRNEPTMPSDQLFTMIDRYLDDLELDAERVFSDS